MSMCLLLYLRLYRMLEDDSVYVLKVMVCWCGFVGVYGVRDVVVVLVYFLLF